MESHISDRSMEQYSESEKTVAPEAQKLITLEDIEDMALDDPRIVAKAEEIKAAREDGNKLLQDQLITENKALLFRIETELKQRYGIEDDKEQTEEERAEILREIAAKVGEDASDDDLLKAYGVEDENGGVSIDSPFFRNSTQKAFEQYMKLVNRFAAAAEAESMGGLPIRDIGKVDRDRSDMHDETARMVSRDLGLEFDYARRMVAKMRESRAPQSGESNTYSIAVRRAMRDLEKTGGYLGDLSEPAKERIKQLSQDNVFENQ